MKKYQLKKIAFFLLCLSFSFNSYSQTTGNFETSITYSGKKYTIAYSVPETYSRSNKYPLVVGLHGCTESAILYRDALKNFGAQSGVIVMCPDYFGNQMSDGVFIQRSIDSAMALYNVDTTMIFLTGFSCNGFETVRQGLNRSFKFRGIFPWDPYNASVNLNTYDTKMPIVLAAGSVDESIALDLRLYDSLKVHGSVVNLIVVPGVAHEIPSNFTDVMLKCYQFLLDSNKISFSPVPLIEVNSNSPEKSITISNIKHKQNAELEITAYTVSDKISKPTIKYTAGSENAILTFQPNSKNLTSSSTKIIVEVKEKDGTAIKQEVINVNIKVVGKFSVTASSQSNFLTGPENILDGMLSMPWTSAKSDDNQWICVDLLKSYTVKGLNVNWNTFYAVAYDVQLSSDSLNWKNVYSTTTSKGGKVSITFDPIQARYIKLNATQPVASKTYSIKELLVDTGQMTSVQKTLIEKNNAQFTVTPSILNSGNSKITMSYSLSNATMVNIAIFNIQGQQIKTIANKYQQAGSYTIDWNVMSEQGITVNNGVYICKFSTPNFLDQKKILILK